MCSVQANIEFNAPYNYDVLRLALVANSNVTNRDWHLIKTDIASNQTKRAPLYKPLDSSVGRAEDCSGIDTQKSLGHWFESGSRDIFFNCFIYEHFVNYHHYPKRRYNGF